MNATAKLNDIRMIPIDRIEVLNPRDRNQDVFDDIVGNIKAIGLKKPVTVTPRPSADGAERYLLVCGEGRLKAFQVLGETRIPALVVSANDEDAFIMSLAENIARRRYRSLELLAGISELRTKGYTAKVIAEKTGLTFQYIQAILMLFENGEERLLVAVERGSIPLNAALAIVGAGDDDKAVQAALQEAYETGSLRGKPLLDARRLIERRKLLGRSMARSSPRKHADVTTSSLVRTYQKEVQRQKIMIKKASFSQQSLLFVASALRKLLQDENFLNLLRAEGLDSMPQYLSERVAATGGVT